MDDEHAAKQPSEQDESDNQSNPGETNSPDDLMPDIPPEHKNLHGRLVATTRSVKKEKRKLKTAEDILRIEVEQSAQSRRQIWQQPSIKELPEAQAAARI